VTLDKPFHRESFYVTGTPTPETSYLQALAPLAFACSACLRLPTASIMSLSLADASNLQGALGGEKRSK